MTIMTEPKQNNGDAVITPARERLLRSVMSLDDERGIQEHSVEEIAVAAGVAKGSIYYHFRSKDQLVQAMLNFGIQELKCLIQAANTSPQNEDNPHPQPGASRQSFREDVDRILTFLTSYPSFTGLVAYALAKRYTKNIYSLRNGKDEIVELVVRRLQSLHQGLTQEGTNLPSVSQWQLKLSATSLLSATVTLSLELLSENTPWDKEASATTLVALAMGSLSY